MSHIHEPRHGAHHHHRDPTRSGLSPSWGDLLEHVHVGDPHHTHPPAWSPATHNHDAEPGMFETYARHAGLTVE